MESLRTLSSGRYPTQLLTYDPWSAKGRLGRFIYLNETLLMVRIPHFAGIIHAAMHVSFVVMAWW